MKVIYKITALHSNKIYIGSSISFSKRKTQHISDLKNNRHVNQYLQRIYDKYGLENLEFSILEKLTEEDNILIKEQEWIDKLLPELNIGSVGGGDNLTNHPNKNEIVKKITEAVRFRYASMTKEERKQSIGKSGKLNHNWKGGKTFCQCGNRINSRSKTCGSCRDRTGANNPFYGKSHSPEMIEKLKKLSTGRESPTRVAVIVDGVSYPSYSHAAKAIGCVIATIINRCKSDKFPNYVIE